MQKYNWDANKVNFVSFLGEMKLTYVPTKRLKLKLSENRDNKSRNGLKSLFQSIWQKFSKIEFRNLVSVHLKYIDMNDASITYLFNFFKQTDKLEDFVVNNIPGAITTNWHASFFPSLLDLFKEKGINFNIRIHSVIQGCLVEKYKQKTMYMVSKLYSISRKKMQIPVFGETLWTNFGQLLYTEWYRANTNYKSFTTVNVTEKGYVILNSKLT